MSEHLSMKAFVEQLEEKLASFSEDEMRSVFRQMARDISPSERQGFLRRLEPQKAVEETEREMMGADSLLADIEALAEEIKEEMENAEYHDDYGDSHWRGRWDDDDDDDEPYEDHHPDIVALFDRTQACYDYGNLALARQAYSQLFDLIGLEDEYGGGLSASELTGVDLHEARSRYLRSAYETETPEGRPAAVFGGMLRLRGYTYGDGPSLEDLVEISPRPLPDWDGFVADWIAYLRGQEGASADQWLRDALEAYEGTDGIEALAKEEGTKRPRAYLDWVAALAREERHQDAIDAATEALDALRPELTIRAEIADLLCKCAEATEDKKLPREARWQAFRSEPVLQRLFDLWDAHPESSRVQTVRKAIAHAEEYAQRPAPKHDTYSYSENAQGLKDWVRISELLPAHARLLCGDWDAAKEMAAGKQVLGWSSSSAVQGLVVSAGLAALAETDGRRPRNVELQWDRTLSGGSSYAAEKTSVSQVKAAHRQALQQSPMSADQTVAMLAWCVGVARRRVHAIVSNQHRGSYGKAATLTAACAEALMAQGKGDDGQKLLTDIKEEFPRHRSFQQSLKGAVGLLRS